MRAGVRDLEQCNKQALAEVRRLEHEAAEFEMQHRATDQVQAYDGRLGKAD